MCNYVIEYIDNTKNEELCEDSGKWHELGRCSKCRINKWRIGKCIGRIALLLIFIAAFLLPFSEQAFAETLPAAPTNLKAVVTGSSDTGIAVELNWTDMSGNETGFVLEKTIDSGNVEKIRLGADTTSYTDSTNISAGHTYTYKVCAENSAGSSAYSNEAIIYELDNVSPVSLTVTPVNETSLNLTWSYSGIGSYNTIIERKTGISGTWSVISTTARGVAGYRDTGLSPNTQYFYRVRRSLGLNAYSASYPNNEVGIGAYTLLGKPTLYGYAVSNDSIYLSWTNNNTGADTIVERKISTGEFAALTTLSSSETGWQDNTGLVPGASYTYRIKWKTSANESAYSNEVTIKNIYLETPIGLTATVNKDSTVELNWTDQSDDEEGFEIWRYESGSGKTYELYATVGKNVTSYTDNNVRRGAQYNYMVRAYVPLTGLYSAYSNMVNVGVGFVAQPTNLRYTYLSSTKISLDWNDNSDNESGFKIEYKMGDEGEWRILAWVSANVKSYTVSDLKMQTRYFFRVRAYSFFNNSDALSDELLVSTSQPFAPTEISAVSFSSSTVKLKWKDNSDDESGFEIFRKSQFSNVFTSIAKVSANTTEYTDTKLGNGQTYTYKIAAYNNFGKTESTSVTAKTIKKVSFSDLGNVSWAKEAIENLSGMGVTKGVSETLYKPNNTVTKAEFTAMVVRAFKLDIVPIGSLADVRSDKWYYREIMIAENMGIISADSSNRFYPEAYITREEIAVMLMKAMDVSGRKFTVRDNSSLERFTDKNKISPYAVASMATLVYEGIIDGVSEYSIAPKATATRAQAAVLLYRTLQKF